MSDSDDQDKTPIQPRRGPLAPLAAKAAAYCRRAVSFSAQKVRPEFLSEATTFSDVAALWQRPSSSAIPGRNHERTLSFSHRGSHGGNSASRTLRAHATLKNVFAVGGRFKGGAPAVLLAAHFNHAGKIFGTSKTVWNIDDRN